MPNLPQEAQAQLDRAFSKAVLPKCLLVQITEGCMPGQLEEWSFPR